MLRLVIFIHLNETFNNSARFEEGETCQYLRHLTKIPLVDVSRDALVRLRHVLADENEGVGRGEQREQFILLRLVVQDLRFRLSVDQKSWRVFSTFG